MNAPRPPSGFDPETFFAGAHWHQRWEVFEGVFLPGRNPVDTLCDYAQLPLDLRGRRVLDIGAWNGAFSFECERRGAVEVVAISPEPPEQTGFLKLKELLNSRVEYRMASVYALDPRELGTFDLILFFGVLYHLRYPLLAVDKIRSVASGDVLIETHVLDQWLTEVCAPAPPGTDFHAVPLWRFYPGKELLDEPSNWFGPNSQAVLDAFRTAGFSATLLTSWFDRAAFRASVSSALGLKGSYEGEYKVIRDSVDLNLES